MHSKLGSFIIVAVKHPRHVADRNYNGNGAPNLYSDMAIMTVHEIRQIVKLPLRQCEGFVNALFKMIDIDLRSPSFSTLSKCLKTLGLKQPVYGLAHAKRSDIKMIAIDSSHQLLMNSLRQCQIK